MLSRAAESIGLHYRRPPSPERSRLDDWFLGAQAERRQPPPVPFFPEVHEEVTRSWKAPFSARNRPSASSVLTTLDGGAAQGYVEVPPVERAIAMQLCPQGAAAWRGNPRLPSRACKFSSALTAKAYGAAGQAASALHAMALLQVHQAKALKQLHEGDADPGVMQELRTATDLALRATKVTARALGQTMSTLVVQSATYGWPWRIWGRLTSIASWTPRSPRPAYSAKRWRTLPSSSPPHRSRRRRFDTSCPGGPLLSPPHRRLQPLRLPRRRGRPPAASTSAPARPQQQPALRPQRGAGRRRPAQPASAPAKPVKRQGRRRPWDGRPGAFGSCSSGDGDCTTPSPEEGRVENLLFPFCSVPPLSPSLFASGQQGPVRGRDAFSRIPAQLWSQVSVTPHTQTPLRDALPFESGPCAPFRCPPWVRQWLPGPACTVPGGLARAPQAVSLAPEDYQTRYAIQFARRPPQVQGHSVHLSVEQDAPVLRAEVAVLLAKDAIEPVPPAEMKSGFYSPYFIVPKKGGGLRPILDLRVLNRALHKLPFRMLTQRRIFQCVRPLDWFAAIDLKDAYFHVSILPRHRPFSALRSRGEHTSTRPFPSGYPCRLVSSPRS